MGVSWLERESSACFILAVDGYGPTFAFRGPL